MINKEMRRKRSGEKNAPLDRWMDGENITVITKKIEAKVRGEKKFIRIFAGENCPRCEILKRFLTEERIEFEEVSALEAKWKTELMINGCFSGMLPILQINEKFIERGLFDADGALEREAVRAVL